MQFIFKRPRLEDSSCSSKMMIGEIPIRQNPTIQVPTWDPHDDPTSTVSPTFSVFSPSINFNGNANASALNSLMALSRYLPSNDFISTAESDSLSDDSEFPVDAFSCDYFRMYEFKVRRCARGRSHDWTECPYAHPGEKARRRDPRKYSYSGTACPEYRKGGCRKGESCEFAHGVFECWLHPARYRTQPCKDGSGCNRRVCFFAHTPEQLRILPQQSPRGNGNGNGNGNRLGDFDYGSPIRRPFDFDGPFVSSPTSILNMPAVSSPSDSPPGSPGCGRSFDSVNDLLGPMRGLHVRKAKMTGGSPWGVGSGFGSPRSSIIKPGFYSLPSTPTGTNPRSGLNQHDIWENRPSEEEPVMERVESGRDLRAKIYAKLCKENSVDRVDSATSAPDVGWVSELVK